MITYQYTVKDKNGSSITGVLDASSEMEAAAVLHKKGLVIVSLKKLKDTLTKIKVERVKPDDLVIFSRQLATMITTGIPLVEALDILGEQVEEKGLRDVVISVRQDIEGGLNFPDALSRHPQVFSGLFINMARAGEASGMLDQILERLAAYLEKTASLNRKIRSSLIYPSVVVTMSLLITSVLLLKVVPTFKGIFEMLGSKLPLPTLILIGVSELFRKYFLFSIVLLVAAGFLFKKYIQSLKGRHNFDAFKLKVPVLGPLFCKVAIAKFSRTFSTLIKSGVPILNALNIVSATSGNKIVEEIVLNCRTSVRSGEPISLPLSKAKVFPPMVSRMIAVGEKTGQLEKMLSKIADFYDEQVDSTVSGLTSAIEPLVIGFLGIIIGGIVASLFLPIFKISELVAR